MGALEGKVAIVTGAGRGIGRGEALLLAAEGAQVVVNDLGAGSAGDGTDRAPAQEVVDEIVAAGGEAVVSGHDVSDWDGAKAMIDTALSSFGRLDILVNNAGILRDRMTFSMTEQDWDAVIRVHLRGHMAPLHHAAAHWRAQSKAGAAVSGRVINTSSESGLFANAGQSNYAAAKSGIATLTVVAARELARYGVTVNAVAPRARTRLTEGIAGVDGPVESGFDAWHPDNIAPIVGWLASDAAADVSGQVFAVAGGEVFRMGGWHVAGRISQNQRWTIEGLEAHRDALFGSIGSQPSLVQYAGQDLP